MTGFPPTPSQPPPRRRGLGRGLEALLAKDALEVEPGQDSGSTIVELDPAVIEPNLEQPRQHFPEDAIAALAASISTHGLLQPIVVEPATGGYRLVAGEMRLRAARSAGLASIPALVRPPTESGRESLELALVENVVRADLSPLEEAAAYLRLSDVFGLSHEAIAARVGKSRPAISNSIRLLALPASIQASVLEGRLSAGHARALLPIDEPQAQEAMAGEVEQKGLSVRATERAVSRLTERPAPARGSERGGAAEALAPADEALRRGFEAALGMPVELERRRSGGRLIVHFYSDEDLDALYERVSSSRL